MTSRKEQTDIAQKKEKLLNDVEKLCGQYTPGKVERILFIGLTGQGKSSIINTIAKQINGEYIQIAPVGCGVAFSKSLEVLEYRHCGFKECMHEHEESTFNRINKCLPHLIDFAGLEDLDTPEYTDMFKRLIEGAIPLGATVQSLERNRKKYGGLRTRFWDSRPEWKVSKIVFVHSCKSPVPTRLIKCLLRAIRSTDEDATTLKLKGSVFLLITKYDLVDPDLFISSDDEGSRKNDANAAISMDEFKLIEDELAIHFSYVGCIEFNRICWTSYGTKTGYDNIDVDVIVLEFLKQMLVMPTFTREGEEAAVTKPPLLRPIHMMIFSIIVGIVGIFVFFLISAPV